MPILGFSGLNLAVVAYAEIHGASGTSTACNSGVTTTRTAAGDYTIILPTGLGQSFSRDVFLVQPKSDSAKYAEVDDSVGGGDIYQKRVLIWDVASEQVDSDFSVLILRTTIPAVTNSPT